MYQNENLNIFSKETVLVFHNVFAANTQYDTPPSFSTPP